jgi:hypothetical protein
MREQGASEIVEGAPKPTLCRLVQYRGKLGYRVWKAAVVIVDRANLDPRAVEAGVIPGLSSDMHVHLRILAPEGEFTEYDVPPGDEPGCWRWPPRV